ncbi:MAG TPA: aspartate kinase [Nitrospirae bacterium]|nr:aspartokinase [bacterium BMS3Abin10]GBE38825.1 aspartokinase [bacterium BMS3Bbin08]HDK41235.1 aspartate kinase [Nitrospirota bacterium]HDK81088.1 aspartate kinase [Nitrospirota bacterium]
MALIVQKYGGTSLADTERVKAVAERVVSTSKQGNQVIVVVSAMAGETDKLIKLSHEITDRPDEREMDLLLSSGERVTSALTAMAIQKQGKDAISLTGRQVGIITDSAHTKAMIERIDTSRLKKELDEGRIPVVAGFQGIDEFSNVTTLGRGGSDTSAVAIAAALNADLCEIYTDVEGVYTTDPHMIKEARKLDKISYDEMLEMASLGARVLHGRSVEVAKKFNVPLVIRSSFSSSPGTIVVKEDEEMEKIVVSGVTYDKNQSRITILSVPDRPGIAATLFNAIANADIVVDMIVQNVGSDAKSTDISFTAPVADCGKAFEITKKISDELGAKGVNIKEDIAKVSILGVGMRSHFGIAARMFSSLAEKGINIMMISTSEIKVSCIIDIKQTEEAVKILHGVFNLAG